jgi:hypothetical protein
MKPEDKETNVETTGTHAEVKKRQVPVMTYREETEVILHMSEREAAVFLALLARTNGTETCRLYTALDRLPFSTEMRTLTYKIKKGLDVIDLWKVQRSIPD